MLALEVIIGLVLSTVALVMVYQFFSDNFFNNFTNFDIAKGTASSIKEFVDYSSDNSNFADCFFRYNLAGRQFLQDKNKDTYIYVIDSGGVYILKEGEDLEVQADEILNDKINYKTASVKSYKFKNNVFTYMDDTKQGSILEYFDIFLTTTFTGAAKSGDLQIIENKDYIYILDEGEDEFNVHIIDKAYTGMTINQIENSYVKNWRNPQYDICMKILKTDTINRFFEINLKLLERRNIQIQSGIIQEVVDLLSIKNKLKTELETNQDALCEKIDKALYIEDKYHTHVTGQKSAPSLKTTSITSTNLVFNKKTNKDGIFFSLGEVTDLFTIYNLCKVQSVNAVNQQNNEEELIKKYFISGGNLNLIDYKITLRVIVNGIEKQEKFIWDVMGSDCFECNGCSSPLNLQHSSIDLNAYKDDLIKNIIPKYYGLKDTTSSGYTLKGGISFDIIVESVEKRSINNQGICTQFVSGDLSSVITQSAIDNIDRDSSTKLEKNFAYKCTYNNNRHDVLLVNNIAYFGGVLKEEGNFNDIFFNSNEAGIKQMMKLNPQYFYKKGQKLYLSPDEQLTYSIESCDDINNDWAGLPGGDNKDFYAFEYDGKVYFITSYQFNNGILQKQ